MMSKSAISARRCCGIYTRPRSGHPILEVGWEEWGGDDRYRGRWITSATALRCISRGEAAPAIAGARHNVYGQYIIAQKGISLYQDVPTFLFSLCSSPFAHLLLLITF